MNDKLIFAFDLGSGSMGICVRKGEEILYLRSLLIDSEFGSVETAAKLRRQIRTRIAHKKREEWWREQAGQAGIEVLSTAQPTKENPNLKPDERMLREFTSGNGKDKTIYSSHLLRIALLQRVKLEGWQIFKAVWSAIQRRGYDSNLPWATGNANEKENDEKENKNASEEYYKKLKEFFGDREEYYYPCYYEACKQGIWDPKEPYNLTKKLASNPAPARNKDKTNMAIPSRKLIYKELKELLIAASEQFPKLKGKENYIIYGPSEKEYSSFKDKKYFKYRGTEWDWQGLLSQKVPRFDNRIISKCKLIPRLNVCKAGDMLNKEVIFLLSLKNMRYTLKDVTSQSLNCKRINFLFERYKKNISTKEKETGKALINSKSWKKYVQSSLGGDINPNQKEVPQPDASGRSSFCRPALRILKELILSCESREESLNYYEKLIESNKNVDPLNGLVKEDYGFLLTMSNDWDSISIPDEREYDKKLTKEEALSKIDKIIGNISNRIVRHRLLMLKEKFEELYKEYGEPERIVFEIVREDFVGKNKKEKYKKFQNDNRREIEDAEKKLKEYELLGSPINKLKVRLCLRQKCKDVYDTSEKRNIIIPEIGNYEIDHIVPRSRGGSDSLVNMVLTKRKFNQDKGELTPYEWFHKKRLQDWDCYFKNVSEVFGSDKKIDLLISDKTSDSRKTSLQATSYMEKTAQRLACLYFKWGMNTEGDKKKVLFFTGGKTADVRESLELDKILFANPTDDIEQKGKNRQNDRHHALDALVLSVLPEIRFNFKKIERKPDFFNKEFCAKEINKVYPERIKYVKPKLRETIYGLRYRFEKNEKTGKFEKIYYFISRFNSSIANFESLESARKEVENIFDLKIKRDFKEKLYEKNLTEEKWKEFLKGYTDDYKKIKKIAKVDSKGFRSSEIGEIKDVISNYGHKGAIKGQWIRDEESHQGQIVYKDEKGKWKVAPVYVFESLYKKRKEYKNKYKEVKFFRSGQLVELRKDYEYIKSGIYEYIKSGIYELKTVRLNGNTEIKNIHNQEEYSKNIGYFIERNGMTEYKNK